MSSIDHSTPVLFFQPSEIPFGKFSNYFVSPIEIKDVGGIGIDSSHNGSISTFASVEHYYQSRKYTKTCPEYASLIGKAATPHQAKMLAKQTIENRFPWQKKVNELISSSQSNYAKQKSIESSNTSSLIPIDPNWDKERDSVMKIGLKAKFTQHQDLKDLLLSTGTRLIAENSPYDDYWGLGKHKHGQNKLGKLLMELRSELRFCQ